MRYTCSLALVYSFCTFAVGQVIPKPNWYSESTSNGIVIQNSYPKGGLYTGPIKKNFNYTHLVFFTRVFNATPKPLALSINFSADSMAIPDVPQTYVKLFLPADTMTLDKQSLFDFGVKDLESCEQPTWFQRVINPGEEVLFYVVAIFYKLSATANNEQRGGSRAEFVLKGQELFFNMLPQIDSLPCGQIISSR